MGDALPRLHLVATAPRVHALPVRPVWGVLEVINQRPNVAQQRELCERFGHWRPVPRVEEGVTLWRCRRCGDVISKR